MDNFEEIKQEPEEIEEVEALWISEDVRSYLYDAAKWTKFLSVIGFVFASLTVMSAMSASSQIAAIAQVSPDNPMVKLGATGLTVACLLIALMQFYPSFLLFKFSNSITQSVLYTDQESLGVAMKQLKSFFKFFGVATIILIALYVMAIVAMVTGGAARV